jgi:hypothetical protein
LKSLTTVLTRTTTTVVNTLQPQTSFAVTKPLSAQLHTIMSYMYRVNPTISIMFAYKSAIDVAKILNLDRYTLHSGNIIDPMVQIGAATGTSTGTDDVLDGTSCMGSRIDPKLEYKLRDGVTVWTENAAINSSKIPPDAPKQSTTDQFGSCQDESCGSKCVEGPKCGQGEVTTMITTTTTTRITINMRHNALMTIVTQHQPPRPYQLQHHMIHTAFPLSF